MPKFKVLMNYNGDEEMLMEDASYEDAIFDSEEEAEQAVLEACSDAKAGADILNLSNPGDYPDDADSYEVDYEIIEIDD